MLLSTMTFSLLKHSNSTIKQAYMSTCPTCVQLEKKKRILSIYTHSSFQFR